LGLIGTVFFLSTPVNAQTAPDRQLSVAPLRTEMTIEPGTVYKGSVTLKNTGKTTLDVSLDAEAFNVINQSYDYTFLPDSPINDWINFAQNTVSLDAGKTYIANYLISVPSSAEPGEKYISVFASTLASESADITSAERLGSLLYITIPGDATKPGKLLSLNSPLLVAKTSTWSATIQNTGTARFRSNYSVTLQTLWNSTVSSIQDSKLILPASVRLINGTFPVPEWLGIYKVSYSFELGDNPTVIKTKYIVYAPLLQSSVLLGGLATIGIVTVILVRLRNGRIHNS